MDGGCFPLYWVLEITSSRESGAFFWYLARMPWFVPPFSSMSGKAASLVLALAEDQPIPQPAFHPGALQKCAILRHMLTISMVFETPAMRRC